MYNQVDQVYSAPDCLLLERKIDLPSSFAGSCDMTTFSEPPIFPFTIIGLALSFVKNPMICIPMFKSIINTISTKIMKTNFAKSPLVSKNSFPASITPF